jgi:hypothetical protein
MRIAGSQHTRREVNIAINRNMNRFVMAEIAPPSLCRYNRAIMPPNSQRVDWRQAGILFAIAALIAALWDTPVVYPLKILVVFFHEMSHGLTAIVTGGSIREIQVVAQEGGVCVTAGGNRFMTLSAGYLGSLLWGGLILIFAAKSRADKTISTLLGLLLFVVTIIWVRPFLSFGFGFGLVSAAALVFVGLFLPRDLNDLVLKIVGLTNCLYAVLDIKSDILDRSSLQSDARMLAELTHIPTLVWGVVWIVLALFASLCFLYQACRSSNLTIVVAAPTENST